MNYNEKRALSRVPVEVPLRVAGEKAVTRDMSCAGVYFETRNCYEKGVELDFSLELSYALPGKQIRLGCLGEVLRVEQHDGKFGVAARIKSLRYLH